MICPNCGAVLLENAKYCESCGSLQPGWEQRIAAAEARESTVEKPSAVPLMVSGEVNSPVYVGFKDAVRLFFTNFVNFSGRSTVLEYWYGALFYQLMKLLIQLVVASILPGISSLCSLLLFIPMLALNIRRLHDIGKSGWSVLLALTGVGMIPLLIWHLRPGDLGDNQWGTSAERILMPA
ncbi:MAG: DUF805 domain-containing protein [Ruminococcus sp.]|nr:DUF805 domain-containing protein [Ruminococcus sp.]